MTDDKWNPQQYEKFKNERSQPFFDLMQMVRARSPERVIDLGCGTGELTSVLHGHLKATSTLGIDSSDVMLAKAQTHAGNGLTFRQQDIAQWGEQNSYNVVFSNAALQWCDGHVELFGRLKEALSPGGELVVQMPMNHDYPTHMIAQALSQEEPWSGLLHNKPYQKNLLNVEDYAALLFRLGFKEQEVVLRVYPHVLDSREGVIEWVKGTLLTYFQSRLNAGDYQKFLSEFKERLFRELPDERPFFYPFLGPQSQFDQFSD
jgi:trans-aconitate 2-methyltransferase